MRDGRILGRSAQLERCPGMSLSNVNSDGFFKIKIKGEHYRAIQVHGVRIVDPGDKGGGIPRHVTVLYGSETEHVWDVITDAVEFYAIASLLLLAISGVLMFWLLNRGLEPLRELAAAAAVVSVNSWEFAPSERARGDQGTRAADRSARDCAAWTEALVHAAAPVCKRCRP